MAAEPDCRRRRDAGVRTRPRSWSLDFYLGTLGWPVRAEENAVLLSCTMNMAAILIPSSWAGEVAHRLVLLDSLGPVLTFANRHPYWAMLAESDDLLRAPESVPAAVYLRQHGESVPLPVTYGDSRGATWVVPPEPGRRWRPTTSTVFASIATMPLSTQLGGCPPSRRRHGRPSASSVRF
jgi:hypothetical protein